MATATRGRTAAKPADKPADKPAEAPVEAPTAKSSDAMPSFTVESAGEPIKRSSGAAEKPNPLAGQVRASLDYPDARKISGLTEEHVRQVTNMLRRDAVKEGLGVHIRSRKNENGTYDVLFQGNAKKRARAYTAKEMREWAEENGMPTTGGGKKGGAIPKVTRDEFKKAMSAKRQWTEQNTTATTVNKDVNQPAPADG